MPIIEAQGLTRRCGDFTATDSVNLSVDRSEIFGFLGPNGGGKSTTMNMLCTLLKPTAGNATIDGHDLVREQDLVRRSIGLVFQDSALDEILRCASSPLAGAHTPGGIAVRPGRRGLLLLRITARRGRG